MGTCEISMMEGREGQRDSPRSPASPSRFGRTYWVVGRPHWQSKAAFQVSVVIPPHCWTLGGTSTRLREGSGSHISLNPRDSKRHLLIFSGSPRNVPSPPLQHDDRRLPGSVASPSSRRPGAGVITNAIGLTRGRITKVCKGCAGVGYDQCSITEIVGRPFHAESLGTSRRSWRG